MDAEIEELHKIIDTLSPKMYANDWDGIDQHISAIDWDKVSILHTLGTLRTTFCVRDKLTKWIPFRDHTIARFEDRISAFHGLLDS